MMSDIYYGTVQPEKLATWESNKDPYDILENKISFIRAGGWDFLDKADKFLRDKTQVDWGSFAYKASYQELIALRKSLDCEIPDLEKCGEDTEFGVVFIETS
jgi:hypothetical protein